MIKLLTIIGARPQIIKAAALSRAIRNKYSDQIEEIIVHTGQHYDENMSEVFFKELGLPKPDYNLNIGSGKHGEQTAKMIGGIEEILLKETPDFIILYGDTNSTLAGAVASSKIHIPVVHIEAGLRSFNKKMPEEINRIICDHCSTYLFPPTQTGYQNLLNEGFSHNQPPYTIDNPAVLNLGDIMYDNTLFFSSVAEEKSAIIQKHDLKENDFLLATVHRDYNTDSEENLLNIINALDHITRENTIDLIFPVHPRTRKKIEALGNHQEITNFLNNTRIHQIDPVSFLDMILLEKHARLILTDSGGVQKEAYFFNKPCIILRTETEWVEVLDTGKALIAHASFDKIVQGYSQLVNQSYTEFPKLFGKGNTAELICEELLKNKP
jgi:UDP-GlcNAc3NAcA epimerase